MRNKFVYILPQLSTKHSGHYYHLFELLEAASKKMDIYLFIEYGPRKLKKNTFKRVYIQYFQYFPLNLFERFVIIMWLNIKGWRHYYIHQSFASCIIASIISKVFRSKTYLWYCTMIHLYEIEEKKKNKLFRICLKLIDFLVTGNQEMKEYYHKFFGVPLNKIKILPPGINIDRYKNKNITRIQTIKQDLNLKDNKIVLFVHWLSSRKGSRLLPDIIQRTIENDQSLVFLIIGDGPDKQWLEEECKKRNISHSVRIIGAVPSADIVDYFQLADVFIMPSLVEEMGRVLFEAMAAGLPIVTTKTFGAEAVLSGKQKELITDINDSKRFAQSIINAIHCNKDYQRTGRTVIQDYSLDKGVLNLEHLFF